VYQIWITNKLFKHIFCTLKRVEHFTRTGGLVGPRVGLDVTEKRQIAVPAGNRTPVVEPITRRYIDGAIQALLLLLLLLLLLILKLLTQHINNKELN
jgi:hypothetical protein